jgi:putative pyruvate formate lyase activating enzyme
LAKELSPDTYVNVMGQYRPCGQAFQHDDLNRFPTPEEMSAATQAARQAGLTRLDRREKLFRWL